MFEDYSDRIDELKSGDLIFIKSLSPHAMHIALNRPIFFLHLTEYVTPRPLYTFRNAEILTNKGIISLLNSDKIFLLSRFSEAQCLA